MPFFRRTAIAPPLADFVSRVSMPLAVTRFDHRRDQLWWNIVGIAEESELVVREVSHRAPRLDDQALLAPQPVATAASGSYCCDTNL